LSHHFLLKL